MRHAYLHRAEALARGAPRGRAARRVLNSTPEANGSVRTYHPRVDPLLRPLLDDGVLGPPQRPTAVNGIAWTFGMAGAEYTA